MTAVFSTRIELDETGTAWIGGTRTKVIEIVLDKDAYGWSPEEIHFQHPHLSLAQVHGALTYYYEHQAEMDSRIARELAQAEDLSVRLSDPDFRRRLLDLKSRR